jgi:hypothetical protein
MESKFGVLFTAKEKAPRLIRVVEVPNAEGTAYGWILRIKKGEKPSEISEVLRMPAPAKNVHVNVAKTSLSKDGRTLTTRIDVDASEEVIGNFWTVAPMIPSANTRSRSSNQALSWQSSTSRSSRNRKRRCFDPLWKSASENTSPE